MWVNLRLWGYNTDSEAKQKTGIWLFGKMILGNGKVDKKQGQGISINSFISVLNYCWITSQQSCKSIPRICSSWKYLRSHDEIMFLESWSHGWKPWILVINTRQCLIRELDQELQFNVRPGLSEPTTKHGLELFNVGRWCDTDVKVEDIFVWDNIDLNRKKCYVILTLTDHM